MMDGHPLSPLASNSARFWQRSHRLAWGLLFVLFCGLRLHHLERTPEPNECADEYAWTWSGMTWLLEGEPRAWSWLTAYRGREAQPERVWHDNRYRLVKPWLDHPPLYSLYVGAWMVALGERDIWQVDLWHMRSSQIPLAAISFILLSLLLSELVSPLEALTALLFYSVLPMIVLQQRLVVCENLLVPLTLAAAWLVLRQRRRHSTAVMWAVFAISAALPLVKVAALSLSTFLVLFSLTQLPTSHDTPFYRDARWRMTLVIAAGTALGLIVYVIYGRWVGGSLFKRVLRAHSARFSGFDGMAILLFEANLVDTEVEDIIVLLGIAFALGSLMLQRSSPWGLAVVTYAAFMAFFVDQHVVYGWYYIPLQPWFCSALAVGIVRASRHRLLGLSLLWSSAAWVSVVGLAHEHALLEPNIVRYAYLLGLLLLFGVWHAWPQLADRTMARVNGAMVGAVATACVLSLW